MTASFIRASLIATAVAYAISCLPAYAQARINLSSHDREAQKLFRVVIAKEAAPARCRYATDWDRTTLDADSTRVVHAEVGLTSPTLTGDFRTIVDPDQQADATAFCTDGELKSYTAERIAEFERSSEPRMLIDRTLFSYPAFNQARTKAVVVVTHLALDGRFRLDGRIGRHPAGLGVEAQVYIKVGGGWRFLRSRLLGIG
ncbi:hypothetical protein ACQKQD_06805 [Methylobacterium sp. NPDC080182]|uniref:hypothetical protein n=1 Tax=Methylobacterium sp. NPDC080182 TaxID=3390590 RepID=UPI003D02435C